MKRMFLIDVINKQVKLVFADDLGEFYEYIQCRCIDIVRRKIGGREFEIIVDDEGLLVDNPIVSALDKSLEAMLVGNLLIAGSEVIEGELTGLKDEDIEHIRKYICEVWNTRTGDTYELLTEVEYC